MDIHVVRAGETVSSVAARYGVPAGILAVFPICIFRQIDHNSQCISALC